MVIYCKSTMPDSGRGRLMSPRQNGKSSAPLLFCNWLKDVWAVTMESVGGLLATLGRNLQVLELKDDPRDVEDLGDGVVATGLFPDVHIIPGFSK